MVEILVPYLSEELNYQHLVFAKGGKGYEEFGCTKVSLITCVRESSSLMSGKRTEVPDLRDTQAVVVA